MSKSLYAVAVEAPCPPARRLERERLHCGGGIRAPHRCRHIRACCRDECNDRAAIRGRGIRGIR